MYKSMIIRNKTIGRFRGVARVENQAATSPFWNEGLEYTFEILVQIISS